MWAARLDISGDVDVPEVARSQRRWLWGLGVPSAVVVFGVVGGLSALFSSALAEIDSMNPWPGSTVAASDALPTDLSLLGWAPPDFVGDALETEAFVWSGAAEGVAAVFSREGSDEAVAQVALLKFDSGEEAGLFFDAWQRGFQPICRTSSFVNVGEKGRSTCSTSETNERVLWNERWVLALFAAGGQATPLGQLLDEIKGAITSHWSVLAGAVTARTTSPGEGTT